MRLNFNGAAVTMESQHHYYCIASPFHRNGKTAPYKVKMDNASNEYTTKSQEKAKYTLNIMLKRRIYFEPKLIFPTFAFRKKEQNLY
jgi:hypothetical protein